MPRRPVQDLLRMGDDVEHYSLSQWIDFARRVTPAAQNGQMQKHLDDCQRCRSVVKGFESVAEFARRESSYTPSDDKVRIAQSYFAVMKMAATSSKQLVFGRLSFDSSHTAAAEGFRAMQEAPRQLLYVSGKTAVDLRIEADPSSNAIVLAGQVLCSHKPPSDLEAIQVSILSGAETVATTATNQFGEFYMTLRSTKHLQLVFELQTGTLAVQVPES